LNQEPAASNEKSNDKVTVQVALEPGCLAKLNVAVSPLISKSSHHEALKRVRKEVSLPGFRKGKAPDAVLLKHYAAAIQKEWQTCLLQEAFEECIQLTNCYPVKSAARSIKSNVVEMSTPDAPAKVYFQYEFEPQVPQINAEEIELVQQNTPQVTEEELAEFIEQAQLMFATWEEIADRSAEEEDYVRLDIEKIHGDHTHPEFTDKRFKLTTKKMSRWLRQLVVGLSVGQSAEGISAPDEALETDLDEDIKASFKPTPYRVTLKAIEKPTLPELNDDFAKKLGGSTFEEVREKLKKQLQHNAEAKEKDKLGEQLEKLIFEKYPLDLPKSLLEKEVKSMQDIKTRQMREAGHLSDQELAREMPQIRQRAQEDAQLSLALFYLLRDYNHKNDIKVTQEDMNRELTHLLQNVPKEHVQEILKSIDEEVYRTILSTIITRKGLEHLLNRVKITSPA